MPLGDDFIDLRAGLQQFEAESKFFKGMKDRSGKGYDKACLTALTWGQRTLGFEPITFFWQVKAEDC